MEYEQVNAEKLVKLNKYQLIHFYLLKTKKLLNIKIAELENKSKRQTNLTFNFRPLR